MVSNKRQLWNLPTQTTQMESAHCTPFTLPSNGVISLKDSVITLTTDVVFRPECTGAGIQEVSSILGKDPFYSSTIPQTYVIAAATVIAWILVVMLIITPRTNFLGGSGAVHGFANGRGIIGGATGGTPSLIGVGSRPWLQKVAALTVAISLTIATADFFVAAQEQYEMGYMDANDLREHVLGTMEIRVTRVISDVFLWLAQVQTLIRLFPRHKEKVLIKWIGFVLILFDSIFSCLNSFLVESTHPPRQFVDAIPALSYLFELALGLLYAAWVIYYSLTKRRYAFYDSKMRSITLIAVLSLVAVLTPVVFFVTDVSNPDVAGWGDYFRWVGAAAASVVVWEWVERIEALERDEKKDGILGREIFDGDEMLDATPSEDLVWNDTHNDGRGGRKDRDGNGGGAGNQSSALEKGLFSGVAQRFRQRQKPPHHFPLGRTHSQTTTTATPELGRRERGRGGIVFGDLPNPRNRTEDRILGGPTPPPAVASPVSRTDTTSAASTVYVVQRNPHADHPQPVRRRMDAFGNTARALAQARSQRQGRDTGATKDPEKEEYEEQPPRPNLGRSTGAWLAVNNPFKRKRASPPAEVQQARHAAAQAPARAITPAHNFSPWDIKNRIGVLAAETGDKLRDRRANRRPEVDLPVTVVPAQPRGSGRTWTPPVPTPTPTVQKTTGAIGYVEHFPSDTTTLTANSQDVSRQQVRVDDQSPLCAGGIGPTPTPPAGRTQAVQSPPRADDLSPAAATESPVVVPAPRRSQRSSPLALHHTSADSGSERERDEGIQNPYALYGGHARGIDLGG
ncbi:pH-response regulator protein palH/rim21 [Saxophila tyrrhenica]|uniref:PH-response regulator protein palH/rim21 n=1 Tax=Saxophila tyrrhenica TaxID=1690608 RepID=A0AAV9P5B9_9PEZI|nr:pH-response regulator protein palH/rim21 [Saxophila tyrrhenica]